MVCLGYVYRYYSDFVQHSHACLPNLGQFLNAKRAYKISFGNPEKKNHTILKAGEEKGKKRVTWEKERRYGGREGQRTEAQHIQKEGDSRRERDRQMEDAGESRG